MERWALWLSHDLICVFKISLFIVGKMRYGTRVGRGNGSRDVSLSLVRRKRAVLGHILPRRATKSGVNVPGFSVREKE